MAALCVISNGHSLMFLSVCSSLLYIRYSLILNMTNCIVKAATIELVFDRDYFFFVTPLCIEIVILLLATICSGFADT